MTMTKKKVKKKNFRGGVHPFDGKKISRDGMIQIPPLLDKYTVILHQNIGAPPKVLVKKGDKVGKGQLIAEAGGFVSVPLHSPTSGEITGIVEVPGAMGVMMQGIEIIPDGEERWESALKKIENWRETESDTLKNQIFQAGLVGMGGAAFPSHVKLSPPPEKKIDYLILNGAECEPYLTADDRLMVEEPAKVIEGSLILAKILGVSKIAIGIEKNKPEAIKALKNYTADSGVEIHALRVRYPQGAEKQLIYSVTGRKVPAGALPMDTGCVVQNVATAVAAYDAVIEGIPLIERVTTVTGSPVVKPGNWRFKLGTPIAKAIELSGGVKTPPAKLILGGPMMGFAQKSLGVTITKNTSGILLLSEKETTQYVADQCISCGRCVDACPMFLLPGPLSMMIAKDKYDMAEEHHVMDCIECGACAYDCPARRPLVQYFRTAKAAINAKRRKK